MVLWLERRTREILYCFHLLRLTSGARHLIQNSSCTRVDRLAISVSGCGFLTRWMVRLSLLRVGSQVYLGQSSQVVPKPVMDESRRARQMMVTDQTPQFQPSSTLASYPHPWLGGHLMSLFHLNFCRAFMTMFHLSMPPRTRQEVRLHDHPSIAEDGRNACCIYPPGPRFRFPLPCRLSLLFHPPESTALVYNCLCCCLSLLRSEAGCVMVVCGIR